METIPLHLLPDKPHLFSVTQHRLMLIEFVTLTCMLHVSTWA